ncbi:MAG: ATP-dependent helicase [Clostridium butyricum]|nr:ATP-dependent helicase [Clostridium butyricum]
MKLSKLEEIILSNTSTININRAKNILNNKELMRFNIHKSEGYYNVYGNFKSENKLQSYSAHLKIDLKEEMITLAKCNCNTYKDGVAGNNHYKCEHIIATGLKFINQVKNKISNKSESKIGLESKIVNQILQSKEFCKYNKVEEKREKLDISISLKEVNGEKDLYFDMYLYVGNSKVYPVLDVSEFLGKIINGEQYHIGNGLVYNKSNYFFGESDMNLIGCLYDYLYICKENNNKNKIRLSVLMLQKLLNNIPGKKLKLTYKYQTYISKVRKENLPLTFTIKKIKNKYIITTQKVFPIPLNKNMNLYFYDRDLYIPSDSQIELYKIFYLELKEKEKIELDSNAIKNDLNKIIWCLSKISKNIYYDENVIEEIGRKVKVKFKFSKEDETYVCKVILNSQFGALNYKEALDINNEIICPRKKLRIIESELNNCRFYFRNERFEFLGEEEEFYEFIKYKFDLLKKIGEAEYTDDSYNLYCGELENININEKSNGKYDFSFNLNGIGKNQIEDVFNAYKEKKNYLKLRNGKFIDLTNEELIKIFRIIDNLNFKIENYKDKYEIELNKLIYLDDRLENENLYKCSKNKIKNIINKVKNEKENVIFKVPKNLKASLREYQKEGFQWFMNLKRFGFGGILCDEMGLGKTIQAIAFLLTQKDDTSLIVCPTSLIYNWNEEIQKFAPDLKVGIIHGSNKNKDLILDNIKDYNIILTSYGTIRANSDIYNNIVFENIILDEGQNINNHKSQISNVVKKLNSKNKFILTGTPIENNLDELWSLFDFIMPGYLFTNKEFKERFVKNTQLKELRVLISPYILRRTKADVINELPSKLEKVCKIENTVMQQRIYEGLINEIQRNAKKKDYGSLELFSYFTKLRQICIDPSIILDDYDGGSGKINYVNNMVKKYILNHKILIFSQFTSALKKVGEMLEKEEIEYFYLDGKTNAKTRVSLVNEFNEAKHKNIFLISLKAGGTGLNLTSADIVIHLDPWWNPSTEEQANDRAHRIGQTKEVKVIKLVAKGTIEEKIISLQEDKKNLISSILTNELKESNIIDKLSSDELLKILVD